MQLRSKTFRIFVAGGLNAEIANGRGSHGGLAPVQIRSLSSPQQPMSRRIHQLPDGPILDEMEACRKSKWRPKSVLLKTRNGEASSTIPKLAVNSTLANQEHSTEDYLKSATAPGRF